MRSIGLAERGLELMLHRVTQRKAFGKLLAQQASFWPAATSHCSAAFAHTMLAIDHTLQGSIQMDIAKSRIELNAARLLVCNTHIHRRA